jgi:hypothetical protein
MMSVPSLPWDPTSLQVSMGPAPLGALPGCCSLFFSPSNLRGPVSVRLQRGRSSPLQTLWDFAVVGLEISGSGGAGAAC